MKRPVVVTIVALVDDADAETFAENITVVLRAEKPITLKFGAEVFCYGELRFADERDIPLPKKWHIILPT